MSIRRMNESFDKKFKEDYAPVEEIKEGYELLDGTKVELYKDYNKASARAKELGLKEAEYGDAYGVSYCMWNTSGDRNEDEEVIAYYKFEGRKPRPLTDDEAERIARDIGVQFEDFDESLKEANEPDLTPKERREFITKMTTALMGDKFGYSRAEANDIAIKRADSLGSDWRVRWGGNIDKEIKQELENTVSKVGYRAIYGIMSEGKLNESWEDTFNDLCDEARKLLDQGYCLMDAGRIPVDNLLKSEIITLGLHYGVINYGDKYVDYDEALDDMYEELTNDIMDAVEDYADASESKLKEGKRGFVRKYKGCSIHDAGDVFVCTNEHGLNIGQSRTESGCEGLIDEYIKNKGAKNESKLSERNLTKAERHNRDMDRIFRDYDARNERMAKFLKDHGVSDDEIAELKKHTGLGRNALDDKMDELGIRKDFFDIESANSRAEFERAKAEAEQKEMIKNLKWAYGFTTKEAKDWIKSHGEEEANKSINKALHPDVKESKLKESQSQELAQYYRELKDENGFDVARLADAFYKTPEWKEIGFQGDVLFTEKGWNAFKKWAKEKKNIEIKDLGSSDDFLGEGRLTEKKWRYTLKNGRALRDAIETEDYTAILATIQLCYQELNEAGIIDDDDCEEWVEELDWLDVEEMDDDDIDYWLDQLYDVCDNLDVWIPLNEEKCNEDISDVPNWFKSLYQEACDKYGKKDYSSILRYLTLHSSIDEKTLFDWLKQLKKEPSGDSKEFVWGGKPSLSPSSKAIQPKVSAVKEDTVKQGSQWVNKGKEGTHGKFKTKKEADAQRKAMYANGFGESKKLKESRGGRFQLSIWVPGSGGDDDRERDLFASDDIREIIRTAYNTELDNDEAFYLSDYRGIYEPDLDQCYSAEDLEDQIHSIWRYSDVNDLSRRLGRALLPKRESKGKRLPSKKGIDEDFSVKIDWAFLEWEIDAELGSAKVVLTEQNPGYAKFDITFADGFNIKGNLVGNPRQITVSVPALKAKKTCRDSYEIADFILSLKDKG